ncbi:peptide methionine sulfoxide reductase MsrB-like isoform X2 [Amphiura filiformis]|uniref:peptide methionine sulfoxide reductase MsrB-like isoform X2 n=1 Tax=Amphiura filiformis TaxID=82378 RepID=UPI003B20CE99
MTGSIISVAKFHMLITLSLLICINCQTSVAMGGEQSTESGATDKKMEETKIYEKKFSKEELKNRLTPLQYHITQERGTERAFTGELYKIADDGAYHCVVCDALLFKSETKFDSGCGWPSFYDMAGQGTVIFNEDSTHGMKRVETVCAKCGAHLGHVFEDGPSDKTGQRYCINSASLKFNPKKKADKSEL